MSAPTVPSWNFQDPIESQKLQEMCDAISYLLSRPYGTFSQTGTAQTITNDTPTPIQWNVNVRQNKMSHSTTTNNTRVTPTEPGLYVIVSKVELQTSATGYRKLWAQQNGSGAAVEGSALDSIAGSSTLHTTTYVGMMYFNGTTDYVEMIYRHTVGANRDLGFDEFNPRLDIMQLSLL